MRYLFLSLLHLISVLSILASIAAFTIPSFAVKLPLYDQGLLLGVAVYWCLIPCCIGVISGIAIDGISSRIRSKKYYSEGKWPRTRWRVIWLSILGAGLTYAHFSLAA